MPISLTKYTLDITGVDPDNLVQSETHTLTPGVTNKAIIVPEGGCFYREGLKLVNADTGVALKERDDYYLALKMGEMSIKTGKDVYEGIVFSVDQASLRIAVTYQCLGGRYSQTSKNLIKLYEAALNNNETASWLDIVDRPQLFTPTEHTHILSDVMGFGPVIHMLENIRKAIFMNDNAYLSNIMDSISTQGGELNQLLIDFQNVKQDISNALNNGHLSVLEGFKAQIKSNRIAIDDLYLKLNVLSLMSDVLTDAINNIKSNYIKKNADETTSGSIAFSSYNKSIMGNHTTGNKKIMQLWARGVNSMSDASGDSFANLTGLAYYDEAGLLGDSYAKGQQIVYVHDGNAKAAFGVDGIWSHKDVLAESGRIKGKALYYDGVNTDNRYIKREGTNLVPNDFKLRNHGNASGSMWGDVYFENGVFHINQGYKDNANVITTKKVLQVKDGHIKMFSRGNTVNFAHDFSTNGYTFSVIDNNNVPKKIFNLNSVTTKLASDLDVEGNVKAKKLFYEGEDTDTRYARVDALNLLSNKLDNRVSSNFKLSAHAGGKEKFSFGAGTNDFYFSTSTRPNADPLTPWMDTKLITINKNSVDSSIPIKAKKLFYDDQDTDHRYVNSARLNVLGVNFKLLSIRTPRFGISFEADRGAFKFSNASRLSSGATATWVSTDLLTIDEDNIVSGVPVKAKKLFYDSQDTDERYIKKLSSEFTNGLKLRGKHEKKLTGQSVFSLDVAEDFSMGSNSFGISFAPNGMTIHKMLRASNGLLAKESSQFTISDEHLKIKFHTKISNGLDIRSKARNKISPYQVTPERFQRFFTIKLDGEDSLVGNEKSGVRFTDKIEFFTVSRDNIGGDEGVYVQNPVPILSLSKRVVKMSANAEIGADLYLTGGNVKFTQFDNSISGKTEVGKASQIWAKLSTDTIDSAGDHYEYTTGLVFREKDFTNDDLVIGKDSIVYVIDGQEQIALGEDLWVKGRATSESMHVTSDVGKVSGVTDIINSLETVNKLRGVTFNTSHHLEKSGGVIAQEIETHIPDAVGINGSKDNKTVNYAVVNAYLIESIKELTNKIEIMDQKMAQMKAKLDTL